MAKVENLYAVTAGFVIVVFGCLFKYLEERIAEDSLIWRFLEGFSFAAIFYFGMKILQWSVWVLGW